MSPERQRVVIAELCGWVPPFEPSTLVGWSENGVRMLSDPLNDLNAIHEAKRKLLTNHYLCDVFNDILMEEKPSRPLHFETDKWSWGQSAEVQLRALIKTVNVWEEST